MLTLNEEFHLRDAIENVRPWASEIYILDSGSTDRTVDIALELGVNIAQRRFTNFGDQWNFALENFPVSSQWTMKLDPDERVSPQLAEEMGRVCEDPKHCDGYWMTWRFWFMGKPLHAKHKVLRLWKTGRCKFSGVIVNEHPLIDGRVGSLRSAIEHLDSRDLSHWMEKQNRYASMCAITNVKGDGLDPKHRFSNNKGKLRIFLHDHFDRFPFRFSLYWLYLMFVKGAWRDGKVGRVWAHLRVEFMRLIEFKVAEIRHTGRIPKVPQWPHGDFDPRIMSSPLQRKIMLAPNWERAGSKCAESEDCRAQVCFQDA